MFPDGPQGFPSCSFVPSVVKRFSDDNYPGPEFLWPLIIARIDFLRSAPAPWICMNIKEVAKRAKVSTATVSRTINDSEKVKPGTAARVRQAIEELNFYPNTHARTLVSGRSRMLGLIISDITNPFFPELVKSFEDQAVERGQEVIIGNTDYNPKRMAGCIRRMVERKVDGVAIMTSEADPALVTELTRRNIPTVFMDTGKTGPHSANIRIDYAQGIHEAMQHLFSLNHRRIAFITGPDEPGVGPHAARRLLLRAQVAEDSPTRR